MYNLMYIGGIVINGSLEVECLHFMELCQNLTDDAS